MTRQHLFRLIAAATLLAGGCAQFDIRNRIPWKIGTDGAIERPMKVVALWSDTVMTVAGSKPMRGFGGRVMFYKDETGKPVKVDGTLVVYAYDETGRHTTNNVPDRKYVFTAEELDKHYSKNKMGHSYSFWVPWDEVGGEQTEVTLIARFTPTQGGVVIGESARQMLPGLQTKMPTAQEAMQDAPAVQPVSYTAPITAGAASPAIVSGAPQPIHVSASGAANSWGKMETHTINLSPNLGRAMTDGGNAGATVEPQQATGTVTTVTLGDGTTVTRPRAEPQAFAPSTHFEPSQLRALGEPIARPARSHNLRQQSRVGSRHGLPSSHGSVPPATHPESASSSAPPSTELAPVRHAGS